MTQTVIVPAGAEEITAAHCPLDEVVTGGGYFVDGADVNYAHVLEDHPGFGVVNPDENEEWEIRVSNEDGSAPLVLTAYAVCAPEF